MYLKLDVNTIIGHHPGTPEDPENYQVSDAPDKKLVDSVGDYKFDWDGSDYVELDQTAIDNHPVNKKKKDVVLSLDVLVERRLKIMALEEVDAKDNPTNDQKTEINARIAALLAG